MSRDDSDVIGGCGADAKNSSPTKRFYFMTSLDDDVDELYRRKQQQSLEEEHSQTTYWRTDDIASHDADDDDDDDDDRLDSSEANEDTICQSEDPDPATYCLEELPQLHPGSVKRPSTAHQMLDAFETDDDGDDRLASSHSEANEETLCQSDNTDPATDILQELSGAHHRIARRPPKAEQMLDVLETDGGDDRLANSVSEANEDTLRQSDETDPATNNRQELFQPQPGSVRQPPTAYQRSDAFETDDDDDYDNVSVDSSVSDANEETLCQSEDLDPTSRSLQELSQLHPRIVRRPPAADRRLDAFETAEQQVEVDIRDVSASPLCDDSSVSQTCPAETGNRIAFDRKLIDEIDAAIAQNGYRTLRRGATSGIQGSADSDHVTTRSQGHPCDLDECRSRSRRGTAGKRRRNRPPIGSRHQQTAAAAATTNTTGNYYNFSNYYR